MKVKINQNHNKPSKSDIYIKYYISILYNQTASKSILRKPIYRFPERKPCRIIVLNNNVPQISLYYQPSKKDSTIDISKQDWEVSYNLGNSWNKVKRNKKKNSSLYKVDITIYPELSLKNLVITQIYQVLFNLSPAIEVSLWRGMKFTAQW